MNSGIFSVSKVYSRLSVLLLILGGCASGPDYKIRDMQLPEAWPANKIMIADHREDLQDWWTGFRDPDLNKLVEKALRDNHDVRLQAARIQEARARLGFARADQLPTVSIQAEAARQQQSGSAAGLSPSTGPTGNLLSIAGILGYELDIWGRLAREREAAEAMLQESRFAHEAVRLSVVSDIVVTYFNFRAAQRELEITLKTLESHRETYNLELIRHQAGQIDKLILRQAESQMETTKASIPVRVRQVRTLEGALGVLAGLSPAELFDDTEIGAGTLQDIGLPGSIPEMLPSALLDRRPDIRAAEAGVVAAAAAVGIARADRLPRLNLAALLGTAAIGTGDVFTSSARTWNIGTQASGALFDFGRNRARVETAEAQYVQAEIHYETTVRTAFNEVRDALVLYQSSVEHHEAVERQLSTVRQTRNLALVRYREGMVGFIEFLDAERALFAAEQAMNNAARDRLSAAATLFKALGGGWNPASIDRAGQNGR